VHRIFYLLLLVALPARAAELPIITLGPSGPDQDVPTDRSFYVTGDLPTGADNVQAIVVRGDSPGLFRGGPSCRDLVDDLGVDVMVSAPGMADDDDDDELDDRSAIPPARFAAGRHRVFELFPQAAGAVRRAPVLVSAPWRRADDRARTYRVLVPHDREFFLQGHGFCLFVVATERAQAIDDVTLTEQIEVVARKFVACGHKASCDEDALAEYGAAVQRALLASPGIAGRSERVASTVASRLVDAARAELGASTGLIETIDRMNDRWFDRLEVMARPSGPVWAELATDPFAQATAALLARAGALLPQVKGQTITLHTTDGKLAVRALQLLDDGRTIRVASSPAPSGDQARVLDTSLDMLIIHDGLTLHDLVQLGHGQIYVGKDWLTLKELGHHMIGLGQDTWSPDEPRISDSAYLAAAIAQLQRLSDFVDLATSGATCASPRPATPLDLTREAIRRALGDWLVCHQVKGAALETMREQLVELAQEDQAWRMTKDKLVARSRRIVTLTATSSFAPLVSFEARTWLFSYVTPIVGYAGVLRPDESFGLFYLGVQLHLAPNPVGDVLWRDGITARDLRRAVALEVGVAPYRTGFGPADRFGGPGSLPPIFLGAAVHVLPYTSVTVGGVLLDRRRSTLVEERASTVFSPYVGFTIQLNLPDLIRQASRPGTHTMASR
jgi:hypothetical protein